MDSSKFYSPQYLNQSSDPKIQYFLAGLAGHSGADLVRAASPPPNADFLGVFSSTRIVITVRPGARPELRIGTFLLWCKWLVKKIVVKVFTKVFGDSGAMLSESMSFISVKPSGNNS